MARYDSCGWEHESSEHRRPTVRLRLREDVETARIRPLRIAKTELVPVYPRTKRYAREAFPPLPRAIGPATIRRGSI